MFSRILANTKKQISRGGWTGWASVSVMTLAFLVAIIFGGLAFISNLYIQFIETKSNLLVFFEVGIDTKIIDELKAKWSTDGRIKNITYTTEDQAYAQYSDYTARVQPEIYAVLKTQEKKTLPSSLDIQIWSLQDLDGIKSLLQNDIENKLEELIIVPTTEDVNTDQTSAEASQESTEGNVEGISDTLVDEDQRAAISYMYSTNPEEPPITLKVDDESLDQLRQVLFSLRIAGLFIISLLFIVIIFFTFMTVEFRLYNQIEEIGVMQLVGGSLFFIRAPYILEGGFYGLMGSLLATLMLGGVLVSVFVIDKSSALATFIYENFGRLPWPYITPYGWALIVLLLALSGFIIGALSSYISIRRYIR
jgi:cell division protein FtsX